jgi:hypothetical protein
MGEAIENAAASENDYAFPFRPMLASVPSSSINARALYCQESEEFIVLFTHGLYAFAFEMAKILSFAVPVDSRTGRLTSWDPNDVVTRHPEMVEQFIRVLESYVVNGNMRQVPPFQVDDSRKNIAGALIRVMELFVVGHEYAHIMLGHLSPARVVHRTIAGIDAFEVSQNRKDEIDADQVGLAIMFPVIGNDPEWLLLGPEALLGCMDCVERCTTLLHDGPTQEPSVEFDDSHPDIETRRSYMRKAARQALGDDARTSIAMADGIRLTIELLWTRAEAHFVRLHAQGVGSSPLFKGD